MVDFVHMQRLHQVRPSIREGVQPGTEDDIWEIPRLIAPLSWFSVYRLRTAKTVRKRDGSGNAKASIAVRTSLSLKNWQDHARTDQSGSSALHRRCNERRGVWRS